MAVHDDRRLTYFSTPSSTAHEAYPLWTGEHYNAERPKFEHIRIDTSHRALKDGKMCTDGYWWQLITIEDVIASSFDRVTLDRLHRKFLNLAVFQNLFMGEFINDMNILFKMRDLQRCMVDAVTTWEDWQPGAKKPPVLVGRQLVAR